MINLKNFKRIFIYQYGKVGSTTLLNTLKNYHSNVQHTHEFNRNMLLNKTLIINVVRNIYDRNISTFFQNINNKKSGWYYKDYNHSKIEDLINFYQFKNIEHLQFIVSWFNKFNKNFNINVFSQKFNFLKRYNIYRTRNYTILILRFEEIKVWNKILSNIFKKNIIIKSQNLSNNKVYKNIYTKFKKQYKYSDKEKEIIDNIDHFQHFYNPKEREYLKKKYS